MHWWFIVYAGLSGLLVTLLALNVSYSRIRYKVANGDGDKVELKRAIRAHGNAVEHCVIFGLMVLALSFAEFSSPWIGGLVIVFLISRLIHGLSMLMSMFNLRRVAIVATYASEIAAAILCISQVQSF